MLTPSPSPSLVARRYVWYFTLAVVAGVVAGVLVAGAGGRLTMRLLAATAGDAAQDRITEADEVVGRITVGGTIGFIVFTALFFGLATGALYLLIRRWLPAGRLGGLAYGALLLVIAGTRIEPLRKDNPDFDIVASATSRRQCGSLRGPSCAGAARRLPEGSVVSADRAGVHPLGQPAIGQRRPRTCWPSTPDVERLSGAASGRQAS